MQLFRDGTSAAGGDVSVDEGGNFEIQGLAPGRYRVEARLNGRVVGTATADVVAGSTARVDFAQ